MEEKTKSTDKIKRKKNFLPKTIYHFPNLNIPEDVVLGISPEMYIPYKKLSMCANNNLPVLLIGETGVGKEIFAKICFLSSSYNKNFIAINCSSIPKELVESELFGIAKGTATGVLQKEGKLLLANGGILLLDELDSLSEEIQIKLLRVLEEKMFYPLGCKTPIKTDFKLISTIKKDPHILIKNGTLREDLYHRISCLEIFIPPLRDRKEDIKILSELFLQLACKSEKKDFICFSNDALEILENYDYLGNIRELKNIIFETVVYTPNKNIIQAEDLPEKISQKLFETNFSSNTKDINFHNILNDFKKNLITSALKTYKGNLNAVAKHLKISRTGLYKIIKRLKIKI